MEAIRKFEDLFPATSRRVERTFVNRKWFALPAVVSGFFLQHALQGWCPPVPFFRKAGVRTTSEIDEERTALRLLRGDFRPTSEPAEAHEQARRRR